MIQSNVNQRPTLHQARRKLQGRDSRLRPKVCQEPRNDRRQTAMTVVLFEHVVAYLVQMSLYFGTYMAFNGLFEVDN